MPLEAAHRLTARRIPQLECLVMAAREQVLALGEKATATTLNVCPARARIGFPSGSPQPERPVVAAREQTRAVRRKDHRLHPVLCPRNVWSDCPLAVSLSASVCEADRDQARAVGEIAAESAIPRSVSKVRTG